MEKREKFASRIGFLLISAGCAIGIGNVWRFPYITGKYGGAAFVLMYLFFLIVLGLPIMVMEFAVGRASRKSVATSFRVLEPKGSKWHIFGYFGIIGNYVLMMFYTTVGGWMLCYLVKMAAGEFSGKSPELVSGVFDNMLANPPLVLFWMAAAVVIGMAVCGMGLQNGVERITKFMMTSLLLIMSLLVIRAITLPGAMEGIKFYIVPDFKRMFESGLSETVFAAMGQAFFTLSIGIGSMAIFGSYIEKSHRLAGEAINITVLDTFVAFMAGLIIFPSCFAFGVSPEQGPKLIFVVLPNIFNSMPGGRLWGTMFFVFMAFAALSTIIAVFENIISFAMDLWGWSRKKAVLFNLVFIIIASIPCTLGYNLLSGIQPLGAGTTILDLEDFIVSNNMLPLGSLVYLAFCTSRYGWGWDNFIAEADTGIGIKFPQWIRVYVKWVLPIIVLYIFARGYIPVIQRILEG